MIIGDMEIRLRADIARLQRDMDAARQVVGNATAGMERAASAAKAALASIAAGMGVQQFAGMIDEYQKFTAQLKLATQSQREYAAAYADVKRISTGSTQGLQETGVLYARIANGTRELGVAQRQVAAITETVNLSLLVSGATASESASAQLQLSQAFAAGALRGEEFNAVNEAAPRLMQALADGIGVPVGALKKMAEEGQITSKIMSDVLPNALTKLREEAKEVQTIAGAFTVLRNEVLEFVGVQAQANGIVAATTAGLRLLADNLSLVAGAVLTLTAVKLVNWLDAGIAKTMQKIATNRALIASNLATAQSEATATAQASLLQNARLAEVRAATLASSGNTMLALTTNGLAPAYRQANMLANLHELAMGRLAIAQRAAALSTRAMGAALALTGGPLGLIVTVLGAAAMAWGWYKSKAEEANAKAAADTEASAIEITASLEKQNAKLRERIKLQQEAGASPALSMNGEGADKLADTLSEINELKARGATLDAADQIRLISLQGIYNGLNKELIDNLELRRQQESVGQAAKDLVDIRERLNGINGRYLKDLDLLQTALAKGAIGQAEYTELVAKLAKETYNASDAGKAAINQAKEAAKAAEEHAREYKELVATLQQRVDVTARQVEGLAALTKAEEEERDLTEKIALGKIKLTKTEEERARALIREAGANEALAASNKDWEKLQQQLIDNAKDLAQERYKLIGSAREEAEQNEWLNATFGKTEAAILLMETARIREQMVQRLGRDLTEEEIADLERVAELKERSARAASSRAELEQTRDFWTSIEQTAHDTFVSIQDGSKNMFQRMKDAAKNTFFDWLYQMTLKKWIINIGTSISGAAGVSGIANAAAGSAAGSAVGAGLGGIGMLGGIGAGAMQTAGAFLTGQIGLGSTLSAGAAAIGTGSMAGITAGLSSIVGVLGPIALGIGAAVKAFGRGPKEYTGSGSIEGSFGADGLNAARFAEWTKKGGWFSSSKSGRDRFDLTGEMSASLTSAYDAIKSTSADYARVLGINADSIANRTQALKIALGKDEAANQAAIAEFFTGVANTVAGELLPEIGKFQVQGEQASATLQRLAVNFAGVDKILVAMGVSSQTAFGAVGTASIAARERLLAFAGGVDALASATTFFNDNFLTEAERVAIIQKPLQEGLAALGFAGLTTSDQFKEAVQKLVSSGALATEEGARQYAGLLALGPQFKVVSDHLKAVGDAAAETARQAAEAAKQAEQAAAQAAAQAADAARQAALDQASSLLVGVDGALSVMQRVVDREKRALQEQIDVRTKSVQSIQSLSQALRGSLDGMSPTGFKVEDRRAAQADIQKALAIARSTGVLPDAGDLQGALSVLGKDSASQFANREEYLRDFYRTRQGIEDLAGLTDDALSTEERSLQRLEDQVKQYDRMLEKYQEQIDIAKGQSIIGLSIEQAIKGLQTALAAAAANPVNQAGSAINDAYKSALGRAPDAAGLDFWKDKAASGVSQDAIVDAIKNSPEAQVQKLYKEVFGRSADAGGLQFWVDQMNKGMSASTVRDAMMGSDEKKGHVPGFMSGGDHVGGWRIVGENGPELEATGPSRIFNAGQTRDLMSRLTSPADNSTALAAAVDRLNATVDRQAKVIERQGRALEQIQKNTKRQADTLDIVTEGGKAMRSKEQQVSA